MMDRRKAWYQENRERILARQKARYQNDPEFRQRLIDYGKNRYSSLSEDERRETIARSSEVRRRRWAANPESRERAKATKRAYRRKRFQEDPEYRAKKMASAARSDKRRLRRRRNRLADRDGWLCNWCGDFLPADIHDGNAVHIDHIVPVAHGGGDNDSNLQLLHAICNLEKGVKHA